MRVSKVATLAVLSVQLCFLAHVGGRLARKGLVAEKGSPRAVRVRRTLDLFPEGGREADAGKQHPTGLRKAAKEARAGGGSHDKASNNKQKAGGKRKMPRLSPPKTKSQGFQTHLEGHGKFNTDTMGYKCPGSGKWQEEVCAALKEGPLLKKTSPDLEYACPGIHLKACRKPSDCDGCLGLYTCKLPRGKCDFKAVSRQTAGFSQSI